MRFLKQFRTFQRNQKILIFVIALFIALNQNLVLAKLPLAIEQSPLIIPVKETYHISQNFLDMNFDSNYYSKLMQADDFYKQGNLQKVKQIQREVKPDFAPASPPPEPQVDIESLSPAGRVYWRNANEGIEQGLESKIFVPLEKLTETSPDFIPGHLLLVEAYEKYAEEAKDKKKARENQAQALSAIEILGELYPEQTDILDKRIELLAKNKKYLEASIAARQFTISYPEHPEAPRYQNVAEEYKKSYQSKLREESIGLGILSTAINTAFVSQEAGIQTGVFLLAGETRAGSSMSNAYRQNLSMVEESQTSEYVNNIGQKLATLMGRDEFQYEFYVFEASEPKAFALPGGKIFVSTTMLQMLDSEAELAGILSHEIAHSVLSHGFQNIANNSLSAIMPFGEFVNAELNRDQEKQADILGTRVLASAGYSADGIYNVMAKLKQLEQKSSWSNSLLSTHPASETRMNYLEDIIQRNGYNRYGYEGVVAYREIFNS